MINHSNPYQPSYTIIDLFESAVLANADNVAIYKDTENITYAKFNQEVNQCARFLRKKGVTRNVVVAVSMKRSYEMMRAIFAIIKAGGTYLPLSIDYPLKRKKQIIKNSKAKFLIIDPDCQAQKYEAGEILILSDENITHYDKTNLAPVNSPHDIAYVIHTSGSTGTPKGVMIAHYSLLNRIEWMQDMFPIDRRDILFQKTHCSFDVSIWEIFWWSIAGAGIVLLPHGKENNIILIKKLIARKGITVVHFVPTVLKIFLAYLDNYHDDIETLSSLKFVFSSGEALDVQTVNHFNKLFNLSDYPQLLNLYGPTEATIDVTYFICDKQIKYSEIPIGKPVYNTELMVLDDSLRSVPSNKIGELYIAGACLAQGYLNNPEQTASSFISLPNCPHKVVYKTGDLVKWNNYGELCYVGRKDQQVKINGIRIELTEIEFHLKQCDNVFDAIVMLLMADVSMKQLVAFIQLQRNTCIADISVFNTYLQLRLPSYMLPQYYLIVDNFPIKKNSKLDRKKLEEQYYFSLKERSDNLVN